MRGCASFAANFASFASFVGDTAIGIGTGCFGLTARLLGHPDFGCQGRPKWHLQVS